MQTIKEQARALSKQLKTKKQARVPRPRAVGEMVAGLLAQHTHEKDTHYLVILAAFRSIAGLSIQNDSHFRDHLAGPVTCSGSGFRAVVARLFVISFIFRFGYISVSRHP